MIRTKGVKKSSSKDAKFIDYEKCVSDSINTLNTKEPVSLKTIKHVIYTISKLF